MRRRRKAELAAAALLLAVPAGAQARDSTPRSEYEELTGEPKPIPEIPRALRSIATAPSPDEIVVTGLQGQPVRLDFSWYVPVAFHQYQDGRFLGIEVSGYEDYGYILVDRAASPDRAEIGTGQAPVFSPDGRFFAAVEISEAGWSNLEGVALWEVRDGEAVQRFFSNAMPWHSNWRVERWARPDCVAISAVLFDWQPPEGEDWDTALPNAPRVYYSLEIGGEGVALRLANEPGCVVEDFGP